MNAMSFQIACLAAFVIAGPAAAQDRITMPLRAGESDTWSASLRVASVLPSDTGVASTQLNLRHASTVPDTTDWRTYLPLQVGNRWQYRAVGDFGEHYYGWSVDRDTIVDGTAYVVVEYCTSFGCSDEGLGGPLRYEEQFSYVAQRVHLPDYSYDAWWEVAPCALDAPFDVPTDCAGAASGNQFYASGGPGYTIVIEADTLRGRTYKLFESLPYVTEVVSGLGVISRQYPVNRPDAYDYLVYARIGGVEIGKQAFAFPTSDEAGPRPLELALSVRPNPTRGPLTLAVAGGTLGEAVVTDALGREVARVAVPPSSPSVPATVPLDLTALPSGVYIVRVGAQGVARVVVAR